MLHFRNNDILYVHNFYLKRIHYATLRGFKHKLMLGTNVCRSLGFILAFHAYFFYMEPTSTCSH